MTTKISWNSRSLGPQTNVRGAGDFTSRSFGWSFWSNIMEGFVPMFIGSGGGRVVKLLACGARGPGFDSRPRHLNFQRLVISCFQVATWLKYRWSDVNPQYNQPTIQCSYYEQDVQFDSDQSTKKNNFFLFIDKLQNTQISVHFNFHMNQYGIITLVVWNLCLVLTTIREDEGKTFYHLSTEA